MGPQAVACRTRMPHAWRWRLLLAFVLLIAGMGAAAPSALAKVRAVSAAPGARSPATGYLKGGNTPPPVALGRASLLGRHDVNAVLRLNVGLAVRNSAQLDAVIRAASTPGSRRYGHYLTNAQYMKTYAPTPGQVRALRAWLALRGLRVTGVSRDNLLVHVRTTAGRAERAFGVTINNYRYHGRDFYSNNRDPSIPAYLRVQHVSGLSDYDVYKLAVATNGGLEGSDFRTAYDISGDGKGQTIGFTLWGRELPQSDYDGYATATGTTKLTIGGTGNDGLNFIQVDGASTVNSDGEVALDTEVAHAVAPGIHETYWLGVDNTTTTLEDVINDAANSGLAVISDSFECDNCSIDANEETSFQHAASVGTTFYFSSGDNGASAGRSWPAVSQYVVAVGGTNLNLDASSNWSSETAWSGSGGGCDNSEPRPSWQTGVGTTQTWGSPPTSCTGRAEPDVAADSNTCAYVFVNGADNCFIGTSLSAPLWAAMATVWNNNNAASGRPGLGFSAPLIYSLANDPTDYANDFHDITSGSNGFSAGTGWDEATGWGSPDFNKLSNNVADISYTGPASASKGDTITLSATLTDHGTANGLKGRTIAFAAAGETCTGVTDASGNASCPVTISDSPGHYSVIAVFAGDAGYKAASTTNPFTVLHIPTTVTYTGPASGDYHDSVTLSATLTDNSNSQGIGGEPLTFTLGAETCTATTDSTGTASCSVTPQDMPGSYTVNVSFAGDEPTYEPSSASAGFAVTLEESTTTYVGPTVILQGASGVTLQGELLEDGTSPIAGRTLTLGLGSQTCTGVTNIAGIASCSLTFTGALGNEQLSASFASDGFYQSSSDTSQTAVVFAFPSRGAFALGDKTAASATSTTTVTWWADNWNQLNVLSGGTAPSAFKGFAATVSLPTSTPPAACGGNWTTLPGNSPPPAKGVPSYMGVLVTSKVTKSGNGVAGNTVHIVVVKVAPGYSPNPMNHGTGTIVAVYC
jgi:hypothetical protein